MLHMARKTEALVWAPKMAHSTWRAIGQAADSASWQAAGRLHHLSPTGLGRSRHSALTPSIRRVEPRPLPEDEGLGRRQIVDGDEVVGNELHLAAMAEGPDVSLGATICPLPLLDAMPPWPDVTCSKASTLGSEVIRISTRSATSRGELAAMPPASARRCIAASATSKPTTSNPRHCKASGLA